MLATEEISLGIQTSKNFSRRRAKILQGPYSQWTEWQYSKTEWHKTTHTIRRNISRSSAGDWHGLHFSAWRCPKDTISLATFASARAFHLVCHVCCW